MALVRRTKPKTTPAVPGKPPFAPAPPPVGMIGLGIMGSAMAENLLKAGYAVHGFDPLKTQTKRLAKLGGTVHVNVAGMATQCEYFLLSLPSVLALDKVARELAEHGRPGSVVAELSTLPIAAKEQARVTLAAAGMVLLDCPLSGTGEQAKSRDLAVYASGDAKAIRRCEAIFPGFARVTYNVGSFGNGMQMKLVANLLVAIHNVSTAEALLMGTRMGLDAKTMVHVLADGAGGSRMFQVRGPVMAERSWDKATMKVEVWKKDMGLIADALRDLAVPAPLFSATLPVYHAAMALGHAQDDTACVYDVLEQWAAPVAKKRSGAVARKTSKK